VVSTGLSARNTRFFTALAGQLQTANIVELEGGDARPRGHWR
jgi:hypothetical protein